MRGCLSSDLYKIESRLDKLRDGGVGAESGCFRNLAKNYTIGVQ